MPPAALIAAALGLYTLAQALPIPLAVLEKLSPAAAQVWGRALYPFGEPVDRGALSLDPSATLVEAAKWVCYSVTIYIAAVAARRYGAASVCGALFVSAVLVAVCTIGHGLIGARAVFGLYEPRFATGRWNVGPLLNSNNLAGFTNLGMFCGLGLSTSRRFERYRWPLLLGTALLVATCILSMSRAGVLALVIGSVVFAVATRRARLRLGRVLVLGIVLVCGGALAYFGASEGSWSRLFDRELGKLDVIRRSIAIIGDYPWFGIGRGAFESVSSSYRLVSGNKVAAHAENFIVQWCVEWGLPVALAGLVAFPWVLKGAGRRLRRSSIVSGMIAGLAALLFQNLLDMGLEIPALGLAVAAVLGVLSRSHEAVLITVPTRPRRWLSASIAVALAAFWVVSFRGARWQLSEERLAVHETISSHLRGQGPETAVVDTHLRAAMLRHPADPYFPRLGALTAFVRGRRDPLPWLNHALELGLENGHTRLLLARVLHRRGGVKQALAELRAAAELEHDLARSAGRLAASWSRDPAQIAQAAPRGTPGAMVLTAAASAFHRPEERAIRRACLDEAIARDPSYVPARRARAWQIVADIRDGTCALQLCGPRLEQDARALRSLRPESPDATLVRGELLRLQGKLEDATELLERDCPQYRPAERIPCLRGHLRLEALRSNRSHQIPKLARELMEACQLTTTSCHDPLVDAGDLLARAGASGAALIAFERAAAEKSSVTALLGIASSAAEIGQTAKAQRALEEAARLARADHVALARVKQAGERVRSALLEQLASEGEKTRRSGK